MIVPAKLLLALSNLPKDAKISTFVRTDAKLANADVAALALVLLHERANAKSFWKPYIGTKRLLCVI
jgi:hypothetical protein